MKNVKAFHQAITVASELAENNNLITFGIVPDKAETGYGYIEANINNEDNYHSIKSFTEKPSQKNAQKYLDSDNYFWNSGMF
jgi:mannose-1-phosphate guanylyltransferase